jgi:HAD superfamily hydrolase (TIGR01509 family)
MPHIAIVIYDLDGVLVDSREANAAYYGHILEHFGLPLLTSEQLAAVQVLTAPQAIDLLFAGHPRRTEVQAYQLQMDNSPFLPLVRLMPYARETLTRLRAQDYRTAIATNRGKSLPLVLEELELTDLFDMTVSSNDVRQHKPHPECLERILGHFHLNPAQALYVGDAAVDRETAARAGVPFAAYGNPGLDGNYRLADHREIFAILARLHQENGRP